MKQELCMSCSYFSGVESLIVIIILKVLFLKIEIKVKCINNKRV